MRKKSPTIFQALIAFSVTAENRNWSRSSFKMLNGLLKRRRRLEVNHLLLLCVNSRA